MKIEELADEIEKSEGRASWIYLDRVGIKTTAVGHALETVQECCLLPWKIDGRPATKAEISADYAAISRAPKGRRADFYKPYTRIRLDDADITKDRNNLVTAFVAAIKQNIPDFECFPEPVKRACADIAYNAGVGGLMGFKNMLAAIRRKDWKTAAKESARVDAQGRPLESRNKETAALILSAQKEV